MSDEKKSTEQQPIKEDQLDKVSGGMNPPGLPPHPIVTPPSRVTDPRNPHQPKPV